MKNRLKLLGIGVILPLVFSSCDKEPADTPPNTPLICITSTIGSMTSRATSTSFEVGDEIGLFVLEWDEAAPLLNGERYMNNVRASMGADGFTMQRFYYPQVKTDFYAYYPYQAGGILPGQSTINHAVTLNQNQGRGYTASDLMSARVNEVTAGNTPVALPFKHLLSRIDVKLFPGNGLDQAALTGATLVAKGLLKNCSLDLSTEKVTPGSDVADFTPRSTASGFSLITQPQTIAAGHKLFEIKLKDKTFDYVIANSLTLESGYYYTFEVTLNLYQPPQATISVLKR